MEDSATGQPGPLRRAATAVFRDLRAGLIGVAIVSAGAIGVVLREHRVEMPAWVFALLVGGLLLVILILYDLKKEGRLGETRRLEVEARERAEQLSSQPRASFSPARRFSRPRRWSVRVGAAVRQDRWNNGVIRLADVHEPLRTDRW